MSVLSLSIPNDLTEIEEVNRAFEAFANEHGLDDTVRRTMKMVFDELLSNSISYAFEDNEAHELSLHVEKLDDRLTVLVRDDGKPFDPFALDDPDTGLSLDDRPLGGVGVLLVRSMMDEVSYARDGNENVIRLVKFLA